MSSSTWNRRDVVRALALGMAGTAGASLIAGCAGDANSADAGKADAGAPPDVKPIKLGFIPLTDCASVVMAHELGLYAKYGVNVVVEKQASWPVVRDKLASGELHGAHCLFGMPFAAATKVSELRGDPLRIAMILNNNGQATTLSSKAFGGKVGYADFGAFKKAVDEVRKTKEPTFAMTFPGGTHDSGCTSRSPRPASIPRARRSSRSRRRRWSRTWRRATWTATTSASPGAASRRRRGWASPSSRRRHSGSTIPRRLSWSDRGSPTSDATT